MLQSLSKSLRLCVCWGSTCLDGTTFSSQHKPGVLVRSFPGCFTDGIRWVKGLQPSQGRHTTSRCIVVALGLIPGDVPVERLVHHWPVYIPVGQDVVRV